MAITATEHVADLVKEKLDQFGDSIIIGTALHEQIQQNVNAAHESMVNEFMLGVKPKEVTKMKHFAVSLSFDSQVHPTLDFFHTNTKEEALGRAMHRHVDRGTVIGWAVKDVHMVYDIPEASLESLKRGKRIEAIKILREDKHLSLKEATQIIDDVYRKLINNNEMYDPPDADS